MKQNKDEQTPHSADALVTEAADTTQTNDAATIASQPPTAVPSRKKKTCRRKKALWISLLVLLAALLILLVWFFFIYAPKTDDAVPVRGDVRDKYVTPKSDGNAAQDDTAAPTITDTARKKGVYNFLLVGVDKLASLSDVMMLAQFDTVQKKVNVVQIPRDTYFFNGYYGTKLNSYFASAYRTAAAGGDADAYSSAVHALKEFYESALCVKIDYCLCVDTAGFRDVIDAIGGVDFNVPMDMHYEDPEQGLYIHLNAGYQHLDGDKAEQFVRYRAGYAEGDIGRLNAQKRFLTAAAYQLQDRMSLQTLVDLSGVVLEYMTTDLNVAEAAYFAKEAYSVTKADISFVTLPGAATWSDSMSVYVLYKENVRRLVNSCLNVYHTEITDELLDPYGYFTNPYDSGIQYYYMSDYVEDAAVPVTAEALSEEAIQ